MLSAYEVAPIFLIRLAGVPFELIERLATPRTSQAARETLASRDESAAGENRSRLADSLTRELEKSRTFLLESTRKILPAYLIFAAQGMRERVSSLLETLAPDETTPRHRNASERKLEQHLLLYLQRVGAKNDTFSEFGPVSWGKTSEKLAGVKIEIEPGIAARDAFLERWTAHAVAAVINAEISTAFRNAKIEVPALEPCPFEILVDDIEKWPPGAERKKWSSILRPLAELPQKFAAAGDTNERQAIMEEANSRLSSLGATRGSPHRILYSAINPIAEECFRESHFQINKCLIDEVVTDAAPWIDLWRDSYAFIASRVAAALRGVMEKAGAKSGVMPLPAFLEACNAAKFPLTGPGMVALSVMAFEEVKSAVRERLRPYADIDEYELTADDCHAVRDNFDYPKFDEYTYPSADLQLAATSTEAVACGDYQWILAELHPPAALLHHFAYWRCPDKPVLNSALAKTTAGKPNFHFGFFAADFTGHTAVRLFDALPELSNFVAPQRADPAWRTVAPAEAEVYVDETSGDVCLRSMRTGEYLGSFARAWIIPLGFHPFQFAISPNTPRLRCGRVIVQRRTWTVLREEFPPGNYTGVSLDLVLAVERLRAQRSLPRFVYIRPTEQALRRSGAEGRDKDTKPVFIDLESYLFLEIFYRWLTKSGELEVTEMLPDPDHLLWHEPDGRRTFELRTVIVPRT